MAKHKPRRDDGLQWQQIAQMLDVSNQQLVNYRKVDSFPAYGSVREMVIWILRRDGRLIDPAEGQSLKDRKLAAECEKIEMLNAAKREEIIADARDRLIAETCGMLENLKKELSALGLTKKQAQKIRRALRDVKK